LATSAALRQMVCCPNTSKAYRPITTEAVGSLPVTLPPSFIQ
jgi:hypothetical protein